MKKPAEPAPGEFWESPLDPVYHKIRKNLKGRPHADFIEIYLGLSVIVFFLLVTSLAPQIGQKLGLLSQKKDTQQSLAKERDKPAKKAETELPKEIPIPGIAASSPAPAELQKLQEKVIETTLEKPIQTKKTANLYGSVVEGDSGLPIKGAEVIIEDQYFNAKATTDENGFYKFTDITAGKYGVEVKKEGFIAQIKPAILARGVVVSLDFELSK